MDHICRLTLRLNGLNRDKISSLLIFVIATGLLCFPFFICSLIVSGTANAGFNIVLTAILNVGYVTGACKRDVK